ncbi:major facilitator superfamily domain-containing protein [Aspergillus transmontanensis]|uniref:Major facilitator superfamily domain-containing protein n=1 Tax=Aspergillus transmontanensis TaxID=1034304 RepID=A0A5N6VXQ2_9EURO|nr:major facilitator superfamily domain-containing protein [Aspergillus transmontanensis]
MKSQTSKKDELELVVSNATAKEAGTVPGESIRIDPSIEKSVLRKLDFKLLPVLSLMYFFNSLDRSNLGNAKTDGIDQDLKLVGNQYSIILAVFNVTFSLFDLPSNLLLKKFSGKAMLPIMMLGWGSVTLLQCAAFNFAGMLVCRLFMGIFEAGFFAGVIFYLTQFYKRNEIAFRLSIFYGMVTIAGAFSGLIAFGVFQIKEHLPGWKYLFLIEGGATIIIATFAAWWLPLSGSKCHWFNEAESQVAQMRLLQDGSVRTTDRLSITEALGALLDWRVLVWAVSCFCFGVAQSSVSNFLPQMVALQGYSAVKTNLYTVAPYCVGTVVLWIIAKSSDHFRERSFHLATALIITFIGYVILATVDPNTNKGVAYFACFLLAAGAFVPSSIFHSWHTNNVTDESQRAATVGFLVGSANCAGIPSSLSFKAETAPRYMPALIVNCVFLLVGACVVIGLGTWFRHDNRRRDKEQGVRLTAGDVATQNLVGGWKDPNWRWTP